jgi:hypothetical protein
MPPEPHRVHPFNQEQQMKQKSDKKVSRRIGIWAKRLCFTTITCILLISSCKKEDAKHGKGPNKLSFEVSGVTKGNYTIVVSLHATGQDLFRAGYKTENRTYEVNVNSGVLIDITYIMDGVCTIALKMNNQDAGRIANDNAGKTLEQKMQTYF